MAETSIEWTTGPNGEPGYTFNPWWGCEKISPGCAHCYAEAWAKRTGKNVWGASADRRFFGPKHWGEPRKWAAAAAKAGQRRKVFCASMADVFEDRADLEPERQKLWKLIRETAALKSDGSPVLPENRAEAMRVGVWGLDWLLLTKRPENILRMCPPDVLQLVWAGTTVEDQPRGDARVLDLVKVQGARVRFLSVEPQLGPVKIRPTWLGWTGKRSGLPHPLSRALESLGDLPGVDWVIVGGESGPGSRPFDLAWARSIVAQCRDAGVPVFVKQLGAKPESVTLDFDHERGPEVVEPLRLKDAKGGDPLEWPKDLRVREFPNV